MAPAAHPRLGNRWASASGRSETLGVIGGWLLSVYPSRCSARSLLMSLPRLSSADQGDRPPQYDRESSVEMGACLLRKRVTLAGPGEGVREAADAQREREGAGETATPRLEVRIPQPREPRTGR